MFERNNWPEPAEKLLRRSSWRRFGVRTWFGWVLVLAVWCAVLRTTILERPLYALVLAALSLFISLAMSGAVELFDWLLWRVFGDKKDRRR